MRKQSFPNLPQIEDPQVEASLRLLAERLDALEAGLAVRTQQCERISQAFSILPTLAATLNRHTSKL